MATAARTATLERLITTINQVVRSNDTASATARAVADALQPFLGDPDLLTPAQQEPDPDRYRQHVLYVAPDGAFSIVSLVWTPGQRTCIHDHVSWCVVGVHQGAEHEIHYTLLDHDEEPRLQPVNELVNPSGCVEALTPPGDIHQVANRGATTAISLHVYGADIGKLGTSILRRYDHAVHVAR